MEEKIGIVVLNYKNYEDTIDCLASLATISYSNIETIVVDNDSQNDSLGHVHQYLSDQHVAHAQIEESDIDASNRVTERTILLQAATNGGYAAGNNLGIRVALARGADYILILNNDTLVEKNFLEPLLAYTEEHERVGVVGPKVLNVEGDVDRLCARRRPSPLYYFFAGGIGRKVFPNNLWVRRHCYQGEYLFDHPREVDVLSGCCILFRRSVFHKIGLLDERTFLFLEEFILHEKLRDVGLTSVVVPDSVIVHKYGKATSNVSAEVLHNVGLASLTYYLSEYRHYSKFTVAAIMFSRRGPKEMFRTMKAVIFRGRKEA